MTDLDRETRAAIDALVHRLRNRGDADDEPFAAEFIAALKGRGWRPTLARPAPDWHYRGGAGAEPNAEYLAKKAEIKARNAATGGQPALTEDDGSAP